MRLADAFPRKPQTRAIGRRAAKKLLRLYTRKFRIAELIRESVASWPEMPPTLFRCDACGTKVGSHDANRTRMSDRKPLGCPTHGAMREFSLNEWLDEWVRRGKPDRLTIRLTPIFGTVAPTSPDSATPRRPL
jgi:hypothetical protein